MQPFLLIKQRLFEIAQLFLLLKHTALSASQIKFASAVFFLRNFSGDGLNAIFGRD